MIIISLSGFSEVTLEASLDQCLKLGSCFIDFFLSQVSFFFSLKIFKMWVCLHVHVYIRAHMLVHCQMSSEEVICPGPRGTGSCEPSHKDVKSPARVFYKSSRCSSLLSLLSSPVLLRLFTVLLPS